jgi:hypothetical protein
MKDFGGGKKMNKKDKLRGFWIIIAVAAVMVFVLASCKDDPGPATPEIPAALQNTEWVNQDGDSVSFTKTSATVKPASGQQQTFTLKDTQYIAEISQTTLYFNDNKTIDQIVFRNGKVTMVSLAGINKPTANWNDKKDIDISGDGTLGDFRYSYTSSAVTITGYTGNGGDVSIPPSIEGKPVTAIANNVFSNKKLTNIVIPDSVTSIGNSAFNNNQLTSVSIPSGVISIGESAFFGNQLTTVTIPVGITSIERTTFTNNILSSVSISGNVTYIGDHAFQNNMLTSVSIPNSVTYIGVSAFAGNLLSTVNIPGGITSIESGAFAGNLLTSITIPNGITSIESMVFMNNLLTSVTIPNGVTSIGDQAFYFNRLTSVIISSTVTSIGRASFDMNPLTSVTIGSNVSMVSSSIGSAFLDIYNETYFKAAGTYTRPNDGSTQWTKQ